MCRVIYNTLFDMYTEKLARQIHYTCLNRFVVHTKLVNGNC